MMTNLNSMQLTLRDLKDIVAKNQGVNHETSLLVRQMEQIVADIEAKANKTKKPSANDITLTVPRPATT